MNRVYSSLKLHHPLWSEILYGQIRSLNVILTPMIHEKAKTVVQNLSYKRNQEKWEVMVKKKGMYAQTQWDISQHFSKLSMHTMISGHQ